MTFTVIETCSYVASNDPDKTPFTDQLDAKHHGERIEIAKKVEKHLLGLYWATGKMDEITLAAYVEIVAIVQRETPPPL